MYTRGGLNNKEHEKTETKRMPFSLMMGLENAYIKTSLGVRRELVFDNRNMIKINIVIQHSLTYDE